MPSLPSAQPQPAGAGWLMRQSQQAVASKSPGRAAANRISSEHQLRISAGRRGTSSKPLSRAASQPAAGQSQGVGALSTGVAAMRQPSGATPSWTSSTTTACSAATGTAGIATSTQGRPRRLRIGRAPGYFGSWFLAGLRGSPVQRGCATTEAREKQASERGWEAMAHGCPIKGERGVPQRRRGPSTALGQPLNGP